MGQMIMIVDDNPDDIEITKVVLAELGRVEKIVESMDGKAALDSLRQGEESPALILLDLKMPGMGGLDTLRQIRTDARLKHIPIVIVTSSSLTTDEKESYEAGANGFLHKHFNIDLFKNDLNAILERHLSS